MLKAIYLPLPCIRAPRRGAFCSDTRIRSLSTRYALSRWIIISASIPSLRPQAADPDRRH